jgi:serine/threonine protein kinase
MAQRPHSAPHLPIPQNYQPPSPRHVIQVKGYAPNQPPSPRLAAQLGANVPLRLLVPGKPEEAFPRPSITPQQNGPASLQSHLKAVPSLPTANLRRIGSIAEEFVVEALLGKGSYGSAYRARRIRDGVVCAVKRVCMDGMSADDLRETLNEVKVLQSLHHPFVIEMQSCFLTSKHLNIVMPLADCGDLSSFIKNQKGSALAEADVLMLFTQICCALKHVHDRKILHRDIKSANILLCTGIRGNLEAKLADFGIARVLHGTMELASTAVGTPYYMSPELCKNESYDAKSDVWALGCLLYEMCTQKNPFTGANFSGLALKILRGKYPPLPSSYTRQMSLLVSMMLEVDAQKRPSVAQILKLPFIAGLLPRVLDKDIIRREFSHTVLHGFCADDLKTAMQSVADDPRHESQFQPVIAHDSFALQQDREKEKPRAALPLPHQPPRMDAHAACMDKDKPRLNQAPVFQAQHAALYNVKGQPSYAITPSFVHDAPKLPVSQQASFPSQLLNPNLFQPNPVAQIASSVQSSLATEAAVAAGNHARKEPLPGEQMSLPALQQPNELNPPSAAFVIVHVETPMHLSKREAAAADTAAKIKNAHLPSEHEQLKRPPLDSTVRTNFTMLGSTLQLEQKASASSFEASASLRVEMLRAYLETNLGVEVFCK